MWLQLLPIISGLIVPWITTWLKQAKWFSLVTPEQSGRVQALATILSAAAGFLNAWGSGSFDQSTVQGLFETLVMTIPTLGVSALFHHWFLKKLDK